MKSLLKVFTFSFLCLRATQYVIGGFEFGGNYIVPAFLVLFALAMLYFFLKPILVVVGLPHKGVGFLFILLLMTFLVLYILAAFIPDFSIRPTELSNLIIFGYVLPSKNLTAFWSAVFSALVLSIVYTYFDWLSSKK